MTPSAAPICRPPPSAISTAWAWAWRTCSTTCSPCCTTPRTARRTPGRCGWSGRASRFRAGPTATRPGRRKSFAASAARGRELAALLDSDTPVSGVTTGTLRPEAAEVAVPSTTDGGNMAGDDFALTSGWGHFGQGEAVMPGQGRVVERPLHVGRARRAGRRRFHARRHDVRRPPQRPRLLAQRPRRRLELQAGRLPGAQEVALLPRAHRPGQAAEAGGSAALHGHGPADRGDIADWRTRS